MYPYDAMWWEVKWQVLDIVDGDYLVQSIYNNNKILISSYYLKT